MSLLDDFARLEVGGDLIQPKKHTDFTEDDRNKRPPIPDTDPGFPLFCKYFSYPAYSGLFKWQLKHHELTWESKFEKTLVHRKAGKSVLYNNKYQWAIQYKNFDVLLLGWTARYKEIAVYVYNFFEFYGLIERDRRTTPFHFRTKNGGRFDCYLITSKETLGMHSEGLQDRFENMSDEDWEEYRGLFGDQFEHDQKASFTEEELKAYIDSRKGTERKLWIAIDDPIDMSFRKERHKEDTLELHFNSTLYGIQPDKWSFTGTRKFEGDFFDFVDGKFKGDMVSYVRGIWEDEKNHVLLCPEMFTHPELSTYEEDLVQGKENLAKVREHVGEYVWHSDFQQNPHPITGEIWDHVEYVDILDTPLVRKHDLCFITVDRATTIRKTSDYTGCVIGLREIKTGWRIITHDFTDHIVIQDLLLRLNRFIKDFHDKHTLMSIIMIVEKQGGGDDFIQLARASPEFIDEEGKRVKNWIRELAAIIEVHNTGEKIQRIKDRLGAPLKNMLIRFMSTLKKSEIITEILDFPHSAKLDAIDALANVEWELLGRPLGPEGDRYGEIEKIYRDFADGKLNELENPAKPEGNYIDRVMAKEYDSREKRRTVF